MALNVVGVCSNIELTKGSSGLGFSVAGGKDPSSADPRLSFLRVKRVFPRGAAAKSGQLEAGDIILRVNDKSVEGLTHNVRIVLYQLIVFSIHLIYLIASFSVLEYCPSHCLKPWLHIDPVLSVLAIGSK